MKVKQAYEVYTLTGNGYSKRHLHGYAWTKTEAKAIAVKFSAGRTYHISVVHLIEINGRWHRLNVQPIPEVFGNQDEAETSKIELDELPPPPVPGIWIQLDTFRPHRLCLDITKDIDLIASYPPFQTCKLYTLRTGGMLPLTFKIIDLLNSEEVQKQVFFWLKHEIEYRTSKGERE